MVYVSWFRKGERKNLCYRLGKANYNTRLISFLKLLMSFQVLGAEMAILDEVDSGLDVDALRDVAKAVNGLLTPKNSVLMITHYLRLLEFIEPSCIHIMVSILDIRKTFNQYGCFRRWRNIRRFFFCFWFCFASLVFFFSCFCGVNR